MSKLSKTILLCVIFCFFLNGIPVVSAQQTRPGAEDVRTFLESHPLLVQSDTRVLDVTIQGEALVIDLDSSILPDGQYDAEIFYQLEKDLDAALFVNQYFMLTFKVEGLSLEAWGRPLPELTPLELPPLQRDTMVTGPLSGYKIALNPGHGRYWNEEYSEWRWQRVLFWDIREDLVNAEIMRLVAVSLINHGATVIDEREMDPVARIGESGLQAWQEAARHYAIYQGLPESVWNGAIVPWDTNYNDDIRARPYIANYYGADLMISLHNNGYDGTFSGTETYYDTTADYHDPAESAQLANAVHNSIISTIRSKYYAAWKDRGIKTSDGNYGEIHYTAMPSILLELAFMDKEYPDNTFLKDKKFRVFVAEAIVDGICTYLGENCGDIPISSPVVVETPSLVPAAGEVCASGWMTFTNQRSQVAALTPNVNYPGEETHSATWQSYIPYDGMYHVEAFIPAHSPIEWTCPSMTLSGNTTSAHYRITHAFGTSSLWMDQSQASDQWVDLGVYYFRAAEGATIRLDNATGEPAGTTQVSFSAVRLNLVGMNTPVFMHYFPLVTR